MVPKSMAPLIGILANLAPGSASIANVVIPVVYRAIDDRVGITLPALIFFITSFPS